MHLINRRRGLHDPSSLREEAKPKPASLGLNGPVSPTGGKKLEQVVDWVRRVIRNFTGSATQPNVIKRCNRWKIATCSTGGLPHSTPWTSFVVKQWHQTQHRHQSRGCSQSLSGRTGRESCGGSRTSWAVEESGDVHVWHLFTILKKEQMFIAHDRSLVMVKPGKCERVSWLNCYSIYQQAGWNTFLSTEVNDHFPSFRHIKHKVVIREPAHQPPYLPPVPPPLSSPEISPISVVSSENLATNTEGSDDTHS